MALKYINISNLRPSQIYPNWDFWFVYRPSGNPGPTSVRPKWSFVKSVPGPVFVDHVGLPLHHQVRLLRLGPLQFLADLGSIC
jgi:hypothetical protein